jgi:hypothetical protein
MKGQLQFGGTVPFPDRHTGATVNVRVWGAYVGTGIDAHEEGAIQQWILNALAESAAAYDGDVHALPSMAHEWGGYVSQQLGPQLAAQFQAQGQVQIHGVQIEGPAAVSKGMATPQKVGAAPKSGAGGDAVLEKAASALTARMGLPPEQAYQAAAIVLEVLRGGARASAAALGQPAHDKQAYDKQAYDKQAYDKQAYEKDPYSYGKGGPDWKK